MPWLSPSQTAHNKVLKIIVLLRLINDHKLFFRQQAPSNYLQSKHWEHETAWERKHTKPNHHDHKPLPSLRSHVVRSKVPLNIGSEASWTGIRPVVVAEFPFMFFAAYTDLPLWKLLWGTVCLLVDVKHEEVTQNRSPKEQSEREQGLGFSKVNTYISLYIFL